MQLEDGHTGILIYIRKKFRRTTGEAEAQQLKAASGTDAKAPALRACLLLTCACARACALVHYLLAHTCAHLRAQCAYLLASLLSSRTDAKVLAGAISSFAREGRRMCITAIGAGAINQVRKTLILTLALTLTLTPTLTPTLALTLPLTL